MRREPLTESELFPGQEALHIIPISEARTSLANPLWPGRVRTTKPCWAPKGWA